MAASAFIDEPIKPHKSSQSSATWRGIGSAWSQAYVRSVQL